MPKYKCINEKCEFVGNGVTIHGTKITIIDGKAIDKNQRCPYCGENRITVREPGMTTAISGTNDQKLKTMGHI